MRRLYTVEDGEIVELPEEVVEEVTEEASEDSPIEVTVRPNPPINRVLMKAGESVVEIESADELSQVVSTASDLFKLVQHPESERRIVSSGFGSYERAPEM